MITGVAHEVVDVVEVMMVSTLLHSRRRTRCQLAGRHRTMILVAFDTGMHWSEIVGLRRHKLDLANRQVRVTHKFVRLEDGRFVRREPKTAAGTRSISISSSTAELVVVHKGRSGRARVARRSVVEHGFCACAARR